MKKRNIFRVLGMGVILWGAGVIAVNTWGVASCLPEVGMSGLLHKALFQPAGTCNLNPTNAKLCAGVGDVCNINSALSPGSQKKGTCVQTSIACTCRATN
jgi:hypothetical protein